MDKQERERLRALSQELMRAHEAYFDRICNREPPMHYVAVRERWWLASREFQNALTPHLALRLLDALDAAERAEAAERDAARYRWVLPIVTDGDECDARTLAVGMALFRGLDGDAAIDAAMGEQTGEGGGNASR